MDGNANTGSHVDEQRVKAEHSHPDTYVGESPIKGAEAPVRVFELQS